MTSMVASYPSNADEHAVDDVFEEGPREESSNEN